MYSSYFQWLASRAILNDSEQLLITILTHGQFIGRPTKHQFMHISGNDKCFSVVMFHTKLSFPISDRQPIPAADKDIAAETVCIGPRTFITLDMNPGLRQPVLRHIKHIHV